MAKDVKITARLDSTDVATGADVAAAAMERVAGTTEALGPWLKSAESGMADFGDAADEIAGDLDKAEAALKGTVAHLEGAGPASQKAAAGFKAAIASIEQMRTSSEALRTGGAGTTAAVKGLGHEARETATGLRQSAGDARALSQDLGVAGRTGSAAGKGIAGAGAAARKAGDEAAKAGRKFSAASAQTEQFGGRTVTASGSLQGLQGSLLALRERGLRSPELLTMAFRDLSDSFLDAGTSLEGTKMAARLVGIGSAISKISMGVGVIGLAVVAITMIKSLFDSLNSEIEDSTAKAAEQTKKMLQGLRKEAEDTARSIRELVSPREEERKALAEALKAGARGEGTEDQQQAKRQFTIESVLAVSMELFERERAHKAELLRVERELSRTSEKSERAKLTPRAERLRKSIAGTEVDVPASLEARLGGAKLASKQEVLQAARTEAQSRYQKALAGTTEGLEAFEAYLPQVTKALIKAEQKRQAAREAFQKRSEAADKQREEREREAGELRVEDYRRELRAQKARDAAIDQAAAQLAATGLKFNAIMRLSGDQLRKQFGDDLPALVDKLKAAIAERARVAGIYDPLKEAAEKSGARPETRTAKHLREIRDRLGDEGKGLPAIERNTALTAAEAKAKEKEEKRRARPRIISTLSAFLGRRTGRRLRRLPGVGPAELADAKRRRAAGRERRIAEEDSKRLEREGRAARERVSRVPARDRARGPRGMEGMAGEDIAKARSDLKKAGDAMVGTFAGIVGIIKQIQEAMEDEAKGVDDGRKL